MVKNLGARQVTEVRSLGQEDHGYPLHYFCLGNLMDRGVRWARVHGVAMSRT